MVTVTLWDNGEWIGFSCAGHAGYARDKAPDIVCAGISALANTLGLALARFRGYAAEAESGWVRVVCGKNLESRIVLDSLAVGFYGMRDAYPQNVSVRDERIGAGEWDTDERDRPAERIHKNV